MTRFQGKVNCGLATRTENGLDRSGVISYFASGVARVSVGLHSSPLKPLGQRLELTTKRCYWHDTSQLKSTHGRRSRCSTFPACRFIPLIASSTKNEATDFAAELTNSLVINQKKPHLGLDDKILAQLDRQFKHFPLLPASPSSPTRRGFDQEGTKLWNICMQLMTVYRDRSEDLLLACKGTTVGSQGHRLSLSTA